MGGLGFERRKNMYHYVNDKEYLRESHKICADIVNQLVQELRNNNIETKMRLVGSGKRNMVTQNEREAIDYDFNLIIEDSPQWDGRWIKSIVIDAFNYVLDKNDWGNCKDSTSAITTEKRVLTKGNKTPFSIDICIVRIDRFGCWNRLIHKKTGIVQCDQYYWNQGPSAKEIRKKEERLKSNPKLWCEVRERYIKKKNMYLTREDYNHPSFKCYIEAINEVYVSECGINLL